LRCSINVEFIAAVADTEFILRENGRALAFLTSDGIDALNTVGGDTAITRKAHSVIKVSGITVENTNTIANFHGGSALSTSSEIRIT